MALGTAVNRRDVIKSETQTFSPPNLSDAAEMRAARSWLRSRRKMLDARNTSITFLPLSDGEQLTLRNQLDSRPRQAPRIEPEIRTSSKAPTEHSKPVTEKVIGRSKVEKIFKLWQVKDNDKSKEVKEETKLRPGRKLASGSYEISFNTVPYSKDERTFRLYIPTGCSTKAKVALVIAKELAQLQNPGFYSREVPTNELIGETTEKFIIVSAFLDHPAKSDKLDAANQTEEDSESFIAVKKDEQTEALAEIVQLTAELTNATTNPLGWSWTDSAKLHYPS